MKGTSAFTKTIKAYLEERVKDDPFFGVRYNDPNKNIGDCVTYILNQVKASGKNGFEDKEIFNLAVHFYDEADLKAGSSVNATVVVNHTVVITEKEKADAKEKAIRELIDSEKSKMKKKPVTKKAPEAPKLEMPGEADELKLF